MLGGTGFMCTRRYVQCIRMVGFIGVRDCYGGAIHCGLHTW